MESPYKKWDKYKYRFKMYHAYHEANEGEKDSDLYALHGKK